MTRLILALVPLSFVLAFVATAAARAAGRRLNALDGAGVEGQIKAPPRRVPNTGGIGIFMGIALPMGALLLLLSGVQIDPNDFNLIPADLHEHLAGISSKAPSAWVVLLSAGVLHVLGLVDDRSPLGPFLKLGVMTLVALAALVLTQTRMFTFLDAPAGGPWASYAITLLWVLVVTNAMNFLDNMDGLAGGVSAVASGCFLAIALEHEQWFVAAGFAMVLGSLLGFLIFNRPPATIFMGDGGSLVIGFLLAFLSVRITYLPAQPTSSGAPWHAVLAPLVVLAVPLYDFTSVVLLRLRQGKSPFVGDLQHLSHRFVDRGLTRPMAVLVICGFAGVSGIAGILLARVLGSGSALLLACLVALLFGVIAIIEFSPREARRA